LIAASLIFAVLAVAAGGLFIVAEKQRNDALIAQSSFLAQQSRAATDEGDATRGALLALAGLPKTLAAPDRPFVKRTEFALEHAMANRREGAIIRSKELINGVAF